VLLTRVGRAEKSSSRSTVRSTRRLPTSASWAPGRRRSRAERYRRFWVRAALPYLGPMTTTPIPVMPRATPSFSGGSTTSHFGALQPLRGRPNLYAEMLCRRGAAAKPLYQRWSSPDVDAAISDREVRSAQLADLQQFHVGCDRSAHRQRPPRKLVVKG
jgi:hypothetical protein